MLQKSGKNDNAVDIEFCEGRRKISVNKRNNVFFAGSGYRIRYRMIPAALKMTND